MAELYRWLEWQYPHASDPVYKEMIAHHVGPGESTRHFRDAVLGHLRQRGTLAACAAIEDLSGSLPHLPWLKAILVEARDLTLRRTWEPLSPQAIIEMANTVITARSSGTSLATNGASMIINSSTPVLPAVQVALPAEIEALHENKESLRRLIEQCRSHNGIIPFVGAGLSIPFQMPGWTSFLVTQAQKIGIKKEIQNHLKGGSYEEAAEALEQGLTPFGLHAAVEANYGDHKLAGQSLIGAVSHLPQLASGPVLTTNFDRILEKVFEQAGQPFEQVVYGAKPDMISLAMRQGRRRLLKLHGDWEERTDRILTKSEYEQHYGSSVVSAIDFKLPLPRLFHNILIGSSLLFVGCSLNTDRTVATLAEVARQSPEMVHFAILEHPATIAKQRKLGRDLAAHNILPIWYPWGRHDLIEPLLASLASKVNP